MSEANPQFVSIGDSVIYQKLDNEAVLLEMNSQNYFSLDPVAVRMWDLLLEHHDTEVVLSQLKAIYSAEEGVLRNDLGALVQELLSRELLKETTQAA